MLEGRESTILFPLKIKLNFERDTAYLWGYSSVKIINFVQNASIQVKVRSTVSLVRDPSMLEPEGPSTLFSCETELTFERKIAYLSGF
jgi:hypothetical protein